MSSPRFCDHYEPHDAHSWDRPYTDHVLGETRDTRDYHWCSGVDPSPELNRLLVQIADVNIARAALDRHLGSLVAVARSIAHASNQRRHDFEQYGDDEVSCAGCGWSATIDRWLRNDAVHVCPECGRSGPPA